MNGHISPRELQAFCKLELPGRETIAAAEHLSTCEECRRVFDEISRFANRRPLTFNFSPESISEDDHIEYDDLVAYCEGKMPREESEAIDEHCRLCVRCRGDVRSFRHYLWEFNQYRDVRLGPVA